MDFLDFMQGRVSEGVWKLTPGDVELIDMPPAFKCESKKTPGSFYYRSTAFWTGKDGKEHEAIIFCPAEGMVLAPGRRLKKNPPKDGYDVSYNLL